jgi:hypothetical protein
LKAGMSMRMTHRKISQNHAGRHRRADQAP